MRDVTDEKSRHAETAAGSNGELAPRIVDDLRRPAKGRPNTAAIVASPAGSTCSTSRNRRRPRVPGCGGDHPSLRDVLVAAHGGLNKTLFVLHLAICTALRPAVFGVPTTRTIVLAVLTEDDRDEIHRRIAAICAAMNVDVRQLAGWLNIFDGLGCDMALFGRRAATTAEGRTLYTAAPELTEAYDRLQARCEDTNRGC